MIAGDDDCIRPGPRQPASRGRDGHQYPFGPLDLRDLLDSISEISFIRSPRSPLLDLRDLLRHDARVAETVDEQRPRLGRQAGVRAVAAPGPEGRDVDAGARRRPAHACVEKAGRLRLERLGLFHVPLGGGAPPCQLLVASC